MVSRHEDISEQRGKTRENFEKKIREKLPSSLNLLAICKLY